MADVRLIDANALDFTLVDEYITDKSQTAALTGKGRCIFNAAIDIARCRVADAETVDAAEVVHGRWEQGKWATYPDGFVCDKCNVGYAIPYNYCPNCGAKMDKEE
jgi:hypothetical protein